MTYKDGFKLSYVLASAGIGILAMILFHAARRPAAPVTDPAKSVGALFYDGSFTCSGSAVAVEGHPGAFLTARHCIVDEGNNLREGKCTVTFSADMSGPFYNAQLLAISVDDDLAILDLVGDNLPPALELANEDTQQSGAPIYNISYPAGTGRVRFNGEFTQAHFGNPKVFAKDYTQWVGTMPMNLTIAPGSSGSPVFSADDKVIGVAVGTFMSGGFNVAEPASRVWNLTHNLKDNTWIQFTKAHPPEEVIEFLF